MSFNTIADFLIKKKRGYPPSFYIILSLLYTLCPQSYKFDDLPFLIAYAARIVLQNTIILHDDMVNQDNKGVTTLFLMDYR
ncbi:hypothetical protein SRABI134_01582 [Peribacillus sp. Bi134]|nr:hypothetical protein SRABI134_01582 [Peribacillus sp. Bi134]